MALDEACVTPAAGSTHFGTEDLLTIATCGVYGDGKVIRYDFSVRSTGSRFSYSAMKDITGNAGVGDRRQRALGGGSLRGRDERPRRRGEPGVDHATSLAAEDTSRASHLPTAVQAGLNVSWSGWTAGVAGEMEFSPLAGWRVRGPQGFGLTKEILDRLTPFG